MVLLFRKVLKHLGLNPDRLKLEFMSGSEANVYVEAVNNFIDKVKELGPLGQGEGMDKDVLELKLKALAKIVPYIRLVESERLRVNLPTAEDYEAFYASDTLDKLFNELIADKLALSEIMLLLKEKSLTAGEISRTLGLTPSDTSRYLHNSIRHGLVRYADSKWSYALA
jgi:coenzyme F420-reducing hydrogenase delta subunit